MAGHAQLKYVMTECSKTQIRLTRLNSSCPINFIFVRIFNFNHFVLLGQILGIHSFDDIFELQLNPQSKEDSVAKLRRRIDILKNKQANKLDMISATISGFSERRNIMKTETFLHQISEIYGYRSVYEKNDFYPKVGAC